MAFTAEQQLDLFYTYVHKQPQPTAVDSFSASILFSFEHLLLLTGVPESAFPYAVGSTEDEWVNFFHKNFANDQALNALHHAFAAIAANNTTP